MFDEEVSLFLSSDPNPYTNIPQPKVPYANVFFEIYPVKYRYVNFLG